MTASEIEKRMKQIDRNRSQHHQMYSDSKWGAKESYDLCINTSRRYVKDLVPAVAKFCEDWFNSPELAHAKAPGAKRLRALFS